MKKFEGKSVIVTGAGRAMVAAGRGCIVNISAVTAVDARRNAANYCSSKAGLNMLTKCMALELAPHVNVNALARMSNFAEVSEFVIFMASPEAAFMTGQTIVFDGGRVMR